MNKKFVLSLLLICSLAYSDGPAPFVNFSIENFPPPAEFTNQSLPETEEPAPFNPVEPPVETAIVVNQPEPQNIDLATYVIVLLLSIASLTVYGLFRRLTEKKETQE